MEFRNFGEAILDMTLSSLTITTVNPPPFGELWVG